MRDALLETKIAASDFAQVLSHGAPPGVLSAELSPDDLLQEIDRTRHLGVAIQDGLAHSLAEQGYLPMYGMPTRVRNLYHGIKQSDAHHYHDWLTIDRDLDLAVFEFAPGATVVKDKREHQCVGFTGALPPITFSGSGTNTSPMSSPFSPPFWLSQCAECNSWRSSDQPPEGDLGECEHCGAPLEPSLTSECREPLGFRTNFRSKDDPDSEGPTGRHRSVQAEARQIDLNPVPQSNLTFAIDGLARTYRLNRGASVSREHSGWKGFRVVSGSQTLTTAKKHGNRIREMRATVTDQFIAPEYLGSSAGLREVTRFRFTAAQADESQASFWLAAPKTTALLSLAPRTVPVGLRLHRLAAPRSLDDLVGREVLEAMGRTAVRAAALSATFLLMYAAADELDIDPEEFDVIDPRQVRPNGGEPIPLIQFADHLVNGAGFCEELARIDDRTGKPRIASVLSRVLSDESAFPLRDIFKDGHDEQCEQACYACLLRYRNQPYHGILDWRLGLAFLSCLNDAGFVCGLDDDWTNPALRGWKALVDADLNRLARQFPRTELTTAAGLGAFKLRDTSRWGLIIHPLWDADNRAGLLARACQELGDSSVVLVDSFNLARRPLMVREVIHAIEPPSILRD